MEVDEDRSPATENVLETAPNEESLRLQVTDLLLGRVRGARVGRSPLEKSDVLDKIEAALEAYGSYFYPPEHR